MNAGLTNLETLKRHLLAETLVRERKFDAAIAAIGLSVAGLFDAYTNRKLAYLAGAEIIFTGERSHFVLPRYPLVSVTSVESRTSDADAWQAATGEPSVTHPSSGIIRFSGVLGTELLQVRVIWTGGYWCDTQEPDAEDPSVQPAGSTLLPDDLKGAFLLQCESIWGQRDKLGTGMLDKPSEKGAIASLELAPLVKAMLQGYIRYQLS